MPIWIQSIYKLSLSVCLYPINVKTAEPIGPKFCVGHHVTPGTVYGGEEGQPQHFLVRATFNSSFEFHVFLSFHFSKINYFFKSGQWPRYGIKSCCNIQTLQNNVKLYLGKASASVMAKTSRYNMNCKTFGKPLPIIFHIEPPELTKKIKVLFAAFYTRNIWKCA